MSKGIRATVEFGEAAVCPVVAASENADATIDAVTSNVPPADCETTVTEYVADGDHDPPAAVRRIFSHGEADRFRFEHDAGIDCPCECIATYGCAIERYVANDGRLTIAFHAADYEELRAVIGGLRDRFPEVDVKRFVRSPTGSPDRDAVLVERGKLTARQLEILETAYEMGYFEHPREANATEIAAALDISPSTFTEHLAAAEAKLFEELL